MIEVFWFMFKYKIKKEPSNLGLRCREFFKLSKKGQKKVLDVFFDNLDDNFDIGSCFDRKEARYYEDNKEMSFFSFGYFCKKIVEFNVKNLYLIDKFGISYEKKDYLIDYVIDVFNKEGLKFNIDDYLVYPNNLPEALSRSVKFMRFVVGNDKYNIKYITYNERVPEEQRRFIREVVELLSRDKFNIENFYLNDKVLPGILINNIDFIVYMIENDINNINYLNDKIINKLTNNDRKMVVDSIIKSLDKDSNQIDVLFDNSDLGSYLSRNLDFINYMISIDVDNIKYVDWHNIVSGDVKKIVDGLALKLVRDKNNNFDYTKYSFKGIFKQNYMFMAYLVDRDRKYIRDVEIIDKDDVSRLVDIYLNKYKKCSYVRDYYLDDYGYVKNIFLQNKYMFSYLIKNDNKIFECIDFVTLNDSKEVIDIMVKEMDKKGFEFCNECFLRDGKYPVVLSNNYRFMREVIDRNFNNLAYMDISMIDDKNLKRIINYACRVVYYIRGNNKKLNFDIDGYFKDSDIYSNDYFQLCLKSL